MSEIENLRKELELKQQEILQLQKYNEIYLNQNRRIRDLERQVEEYYAEVRNLKRNNKKLVDKQVSILLNSILEVLTIDHENPIENDSKAAEKKIFKRKQTRLKLEDKYKFIINKISNTLISIGLQAYIPTNDKDFGSNTYNVFGIKETDDPNKHNKIAFINKIGLKNIASEDMVIKPEVIIYRYEDSEGVK